MKEVLRENLEPGKIYYIQCLTLDNDKNLSRMNISKFVLVYSRNLKM